MSFKDVHYVFFSKQQKNIVFEFVKRVSLNRASDFRSQQRKYLTRMFKTYLSNAAE